MPGFEPWLRHDSSRGPDFDLLTAVARRLNQFDRLCNKIAQPFGWNFTREKLNAWLSRLDHDRRATLSLAA